MSDESRSERDLDRFTERRVADWGMSAKEMFVDSSPRSRWTRDTRGAVLAASDITVSRLTDRWHCGRCTQDVLDPMFEVPRPLNEVACAMFMSALAHAVLQ